MKTWKKYVIGGLAGLTLSGGLYLKGNNLIRKAETIRKDNPKISQLEDLESKGKGLEYLMLAYSAKTNKDSNDLENNLQTIENYKEVVSNLNCARNAVYSDSNLTRLLEKERNYDYDARGLQAPLITIECFSIFWAIFATIMTPFVVIGAGMYYLGEYLDKKKKK